MKRWKLSEQVPEEAFEALSAFPRLIAAILWRRGIRTKEEAERFLTPNWERDVHDPFLFRDMQKAVDRIMSAVERKEKVVIHGDYDADGVSGSVILYTVLKKIGADVGVYLPHREKEGYGMRSETIEKLAEEGCKLIITTDCGISNEKEVSLAVSKGIDVIITDHHSLPDILPPAYAILHPLGEGETYPFKHLTGGGVAFKLCQALWKAAGLPEGQDKWLLDMVSISTVADFGKLSGENRALVHYGLLVLNKTKREGLAKLIEISRFNGKQLDTGSIGFQIAPRINAAGRMDHAKRAFDLLTVETGSEAEELAELLEKLNGERRVMTEKILKEALPLAETQKDQFGIVVFGDGWPVSLCGLIASRLVDKHYRPTIVMGKNQEGKFHGSGRSIPGFDITGALRKCGEVFEKFGGHPMACGMTIPDQKMFDAFKEKFLEIAGEELSGEDLIPSIEVEEELDLGDANIRTLELLSKLEPFGEGNPRPKVLFKDVRVVMSQSVGTEGKHLKLLVSDKLGSRLKLIAFRFGSMADEIVPGSNIDVVVELDINEWNGRKEPQGRVIDLKLVHEKVPA